MTVRATRNQGKSMFVKEVLNDDPQANHQAVNAAWRAARDVGEHQPHARQPDAVAAGAGRGLAGRAPKNAAGDRRPARTSPRYDRPRPLRSDGPATAPAGRRKNSLMDLEVEIDRLLMKVAAIGTLPEVEDSLRKTRRQLYAGLAAQS